MKKTFLILLSLVLLAPSTFAAEIFSLYSNELEKQHVQDLAPVTIKALKANEITATHGINLLLDNDAWILWQAGAMEISGSAVVNGRVSPSPQASFSENYKILHIPVKADFLIGENLEINALKVRTYDQDFSKRYLGLDLNNNFMADFFDIIPYEVQDVEKTDNTIPYPVSNVSYTLKEDEFDLKWSLSPDYDLASIRIDKYLKTDGVSQKISKVYDNLGTHFIDKKPLPEVDSVIYELIAVDNLGQESVPVKIEIDLTPYQIENPLDPNLPEVQTPGLESPNAQYSAQEFEFLQTRLNYYFLRYQASCFIEGVPVAENDSLCLWARIRLIHAQEITSKTLVEGLALSEQDLNVISLRRKWPQMRYDDNCLKAAIPASYCPLLKDDLKRISYFLD